MDFSNLINFSWTVVVLVTVFDDKPKCHESIEPTDET